MRVCDADRDRVIAELRDRFADGFLAQESFVLRVDAALRARWHSDLVLPDMTVSRNHAGLRRGADDWLLTDAGSTNGTRVNGWRVTEPVPLRAGDEVRFGAITLVVTDHAHRAGAAITP